MKRKSAYSNPEMLKNENSSFRIARSPKNRPSEQSRIRAQMHPFCLGKPVDSALGICVLSISESPWRVHGSLGKPFRESSANLQPFYLGKPIHSALESASLTILVHQFHVTDSPIQKNDTDLQLIPKYSFSAFAHHADSCQEDFYYKVDSVPAA